MLDRGVPGLIGLFKGASLSILTEAGNPGTRRVFAIRRNALEHG